MVGALLVGVTAGVVGALVLDNATDVPLWVSVPSLGGAGGMFVFQLRTGWSGWPGRGLSWTSRRPFFGKAGKN